MALRLYRKITSKALKGGLLQSSIQRCSSAAQASQISLSHIRTSESNPVNHSYDHACKFYTLQEEIKKQIFQHGGLPKQFEKQIKTFGELCFMIREPALELLHYLKEADYSKPAIRYVLYGDLGCGKSITMAHILHYGATTGHILIHVPWLPNWMKRCKEVSNSLTREGFVDLNIDAAAWLLHFKTQNEQLLKKLDLNLSQEYVWSPREKSSQGAPFVELIEHGISRAKYASECVIALLKEIKYHSTNGRCKTLVAIDGFNAFFHPKTLVKTDVGISVSPSRISLTEGFLEVTKFDWALCHDLLGRVVPDVSSTTASDIFNGAVKVFSQKCNAAIVLIIDRNAVPLDRRESDLPIYLLDQKGFEHLDPFVPIYVPSYSDKEIQSCLDYYVDRRWLQNEQACSEEGRKELSFLSANNPWKLMELCGPL